MKREEIAATASGAKDDFSQRAGSPTINNPVTMVSPIMHRALIITVVRAENMKLSVEMSRAECSATGKNVKVRFSVVAADQKLSAHFAQDWCLPE